MHACMYHHTFVCVCVSARAQPPSLRFWCMLLLRRKFARTHFIVCLSIYVYAHACVYKYLCVFYTTTGKATWDAPHTWEEHKDKKTGDIFYFNRESGENQWLKPVELGWEKIYADYEEEREEL